MSHRTRLKRYREGVVVLRTAILVIFLLLILLFVIGLVVGIIYFVYRMLRSRRVLGNEPRHSQDRPTERGPASTRHDRTLISETTSENEYQKADRLYVDLRRLHEGGLLSREEFDERLARLMVKDSEGRWWAKASETGEWHYHDGSAWVKGVPPVV